MEVNNQEIGGGDETKTIIQESSNIDNINTDNNNNDDEEERSNEIKKPHQRKNNMIVDEEEDDEDIYSTQQAAKPSLDDSTNEEQQQQQSSQQSQDEDKTTTTTTTTTSANSENEKSNDESADEEKEFKSKETKEERKERKRAEKEAKKAAKKSETKEERKERKKAEKEAKKAKKAAAAEKVSKTTGDLDFDDEEATNKDGDDSDIDQDDGTEKPKRLGRMKKSKSRELAVVEQDDDDDLFGDEEMAEQGLLEPKKKRKKDQDEDYQDDDDDEQTNNAEDGGEQDGDEQQQDDDDDDYSGSKKSKKGKKSKKEPKEPKEKKRRKEKQVDDSFSKDLGKRNTHRKMDQSKVIAMETPAVLELIRKMSIAAEQDRQANKQKKPALNKTLMLNDVESMLSKKILYQVFLDQDIFESIADWLKPLPDGSLPNHRIKEVLLKALYALPSDKERIKSSGIAKTIMTIKRNDSETTSIKKLAYDIYDKWTRPTFAKQEHNFVDIKSISPPMESEDSGALHKKATEYLPEHIKHASGCQKVRLDYTNRPINSYTGSPQDSPVRTINRIDKEIEKILKKTTYKGAARAHNISVEGRKMYS